LSEEVIIKQGGSMSVEAKRQLEEAQKKVLESQRICAWCNDSFSTVEELIEHLYIEQGYK